MRSFSIVLIFFPCFCIGQIFSTLNGPPIYLSKEYIKKNKITCLTFAEIFDYKRGGALHAGKYDLVFDTSGNPIKFIFKDPSEPRKPKTSIDPTLYLIDRVDTTGMTKFDTIIFDQNKNIIKTTFYGYKHYYQYDTKNRLCQSTDITPQMGPSTFDEMQITYDDLGNPMTYFYKQGKLKYGSVDSVVNSNVKYSFIYKDNLLTSIIDTSYKDNKIYYTNTFNLEYESGVLSKLDYPKTKNEAEHFFIKINSCK